MSSKIWISYSSYRVPKFKLGSVVLSSACVRSSSPPIDMETGEMFDVPPQYMPSYRLVLGTGKWDKLLAL